MRIIRPTNNPVDNINLGNATLPALPFFIAPNNNIRGFAFFNSSKHKLNLSLEIFLNEVTVSNNDEIIKSLSFELLKISFIRNIKSDRFNFLILGLVITTILFVIAFMIYNSQTIYAIEIVESLKKMKK